MVEDFEEVDSLPDGWTLQTQEGEYRTKAVAVANSGLKSLVLAGAGGAAELRSTSIELEPAMAIVADVAARAEQFKAASCTFGVIAGDDSSSLGRFVPIAPLSESWNNWTPIRFFYSHGSKADVSWALRLQGEGLVRLDGLHIARYSVDQNYGLTESDFERSVEEKPPDWWLSHEGKTGKVLLATAEPFSGESCVRLEGVGQWCVYTAAALGIPKAAEQVMFQGVARVHKGIAQLKLEYIKDGQCQDATYSVSAEDADWQFLSVALEPAKASAADSLRFSLNAMSGQTMTTYSVDFDGMAVLAW